MIISIILRYRSGSSWGQGGVPVICFCIFTPTHLTSIYFKRVGSTTKWFNRQLVHHYMSLSHAPWLDSINVKGLPKETAKHEDIKYVFIYIYHSMALFINGLDVYLLMPFVLFLPYGYQNDEWKPQPFQQSAMTPGIQIILTTPKNWKCGLLRCLHLGSLGAKCFFK